MEQTILSSSRSNNILDLCFTSNLDLIYNINISSSKHSDHSMIDLSVYDPKLIKDTYNTAGSQAISKLNFYEAD